MNQNGPGLSLTGLFHPCQWIMHGLAWASSIGWSASSSGSPDTNREGTSDVAPGCGRNRMVYSSHFLQTFLKLSWHFLELFAACQAFLCQAFLCQAFPVNTERWERKHSHHCVGPEEFLILQWEISSNCVELTDFVRWRGQQGVFSRTFWCQKNIASWTWRCHTKF